MKSIGFIPLRKNSKGILRKNKRKMLGKPLFTWVLGEAIFSNLDRVIVYTDDEEIIDFIHKEYHWTDNVIPYLRPKETATDTASTELAIMDFCKKTHFNFEFFCLLQATNPFTTAQDINKCLDKVLTAQYDSALTVVKTHRFIWNSKGKALNYPIFNRPRRQEFEGLLVENGAVYTSTKKALQSAKNRISGNIALIEMHESSYQEIDSETDWKIVEQLLAEKLKEDKAPHKITHLVLDVDGVFTAGEVAYDKKGELSKTFDMRDGMGLEIIREHGIELMVMTSEKSDIVAQRMKKLNIENVYLGVKDKFSRLKHLLLHKGISKNNVAYVGDDVNDFANICSVGWSFAPRNATPLIKQNADVILHKDSGNGAIRAACQFILQYNKRFK